MFHVRHHYDIEYLTVGTHLPLNTQISSSACGYAVRIQAMPDGASVSARKLAEIFKESEYMIARALRELEAAGYLVREKVRIEGQRIITVTTFYEHPDDRLLPSVPAATAVRKAAPVRVPVAAPVPVPMPVATPVPVLDATPVPVPESTPVPAPPLPPEPPAAPAPAPRPQPVDTPEPPQTAPEAPKAPAAPKPPKTTKGPKAPKAPAAPPTFTPTPVTDLLSGLRLVDARLTLSVRDVLRLAPAVSAWLDRGVPPAHVVRTLTSALPAGAIFRPAALLEHRLTEWLPPPLPVRPAEQPVRAPAGAMTRDCQFCGLPFADPPASSQDRPASSTSLVRCPRCRTAETWTAAAPRPAALRNLQAPVRLRTGAAASGRTPAARTRSAAATAAPR
ncbi:hypothetical protein [Streptomyces sp. NPDC052496]|uniref:hypothetical protein n=1 Tax=Streptomyces sp. NPDC052496 TaxID=3154951 RepID=UPI0034167BF5